MNMPTMYSPAQSKRLASNVQHTPRVNDLRCVTTPIYVTSPAVVHTHAATTNTLACQDVSLCGNSVPNFLTQRKEVDGLPLEAVLR